MPLREFHPAVTAWFEGRFEGPTEAQARAWPAIRSGRHTLVSAPTGSGKTLAAFLSAIDGLVRLGEEGKLEDETHVLYVSPLKALSNDIHKNLEEPLSGIGAELAIRGHPEVEIRTLVRTGDTPARERQAMVRRPPHIVVTTPESLYILLTSERGRNMLRTVSTVIVDEIHAVVGTKRGSHLALTLERLEHLAEGPLLRIGLSATQNPIEEVARFLVGTRNLEADGTPRCTILDGGHVRRLDLALEVPDSPLEAVMSGEVWEELFRRMAELVEEHRTTLVFVNTRRMAERVARHLSELVGEENVTSHHGSLSKEKRLRAETRLKEGSLRALVATASLELGIDIGDVELVCQIGSPRAIAAFLQRVGRSNHAVGGLPKGRLFPLSRDDLVECAALLDAVRRGELDRIEMPGAPLDILAQQIVAEVASGEWKEGELFELVRSAYPYRDLSYDSFDQVVKMLSYGFATRRGRRSTYLHRDAVNRRIRPRRGARLSAITSGGAIPDTADYQVLQEPAGLLVGTVNEDFAIESMAGDIFQLGNTSWRILRVERGTVRVEDAAGLPPTIPFWLGEAPGRTPELSHAVSRLRGELQRVLEEAELPGAMQWVEEDLALPEPAARQLVDYLAAARAALGVLPTQETLVLERFFDETGGMQLVLHAPLGIRVNRAWGLALRKRFCRKFNFELQAAATDDAIVLSLGPTHSFPLEEVYRYLNAKTVRQLLVQALLDAPMFAVRWRWNAGRALAVPRFSGGRKVPPQLQRMQADDLISVIFPDQMACLENIQGDREIPDHPLVNQTLHDCLTEAMDIDRLEVLLRDLDGGRVNGLARDVTEPSPLSMEILNAKPYAFLDDAPLEERRTQAVMGRRWTDPKAASDLGALDRGAVDRVKEEAWPEARDADELHDALLLLGFMTAEEGRREEPWSGFLAGLAREGRAGEIRRPDTRLVLWTTAERAAELRAVFPDGSCEPELAVPGEPAADVSREDALVELVRSRLEGLGPVTVEQLGLGFGLPASEFAAPLAALEGEGFALRGRFTPGVEDEEWCERGLLARIHRATLHRLRKEIEPVPAASFVRFLLRWQGVLPGEQGEGPDHLARVVEQLEGFEAAAASWEGDLLPARVKDYDPAWLDALCLSGRVAWVRRRPPATGSDGARGAGPVRSTPIALVRRSTTGMWIGNGIRGNGDAEPSLSGGARSVRELLDARGALFFHELQEGTGLLRTQLEEALGELVAWGLVTADSFTGLRALLVPPDRRKGSGSGRRKAPFGVEDAGRWSLVPHPAAPAASAKPGRRPARADEALVEEMGRVLLRRYGIVFRRMLERESGLPPWRDLLRFYHRLEARGEVRGGRFVAGFPGEQFALPEAVGTLREISRRTAEDELVSVSGSDPLNLVGVITPGPRLPALAGNRVLYRDGVPLALQAGGETRMLAEIETEREWKAKKALARRALPPRLRTYLGG